VRSWLSLAALAIVVAALALWAHYKPAPATGETHALSTLDAKAVRRIRLERTVAGAAERVVLEKEDGGPWHMTEPTRARADPIQVERALSILSARSGVRYPATDASRYGLDKPAAVLTLDDQTFTFGAINKTTTEQYVAAGKEVYVVPLAIGAALPRNADALLARNLFAPTEAPKRFDLPGFTVALEEGTWAVAPSMPDVGPDERNAWVDMWRQASAIAVSRNTADASKEEITVQLKDDRTIPIRILQREPELVLVRADEGVAYHFVAEVARRMLAPPGAARGERVNK
jgi:hypothetical protein